MHGWESELLGEKLVAVAVAVALALASLKVVGGQLDSAADRRSTMLERHSRLEAPAGLSPNMSVRKEHKVTIQKTEVDMFQHIFLGAFGLILMYTALLNLYTNVAP